MSHSFYFSYLITNRIKRSIFFNIFEKPSINYLKKLFILFLFLSAAKLISAQPYYFKRYQVENGLSNNTVFCSIQDKNGFMWFGTKDGLNRFDGYTFKTYRHDPEQKKSFGNDLIYVLHNDEENRLWVGTGNGLYLYNPKDESFSLLNGTKNLKINSITNDRKGNLWIISDSRIYTYNSKQNKFYAFGKRAAFSANSVLVTNSGSIWVSSMQGTIEKYDPLHNTFESHYVMSNAKGYESGWTTKMVDDGNGKLIIGTANQGIKLFDLKTHTITELTTFNQNKTSIFVRDIVKSGNYKFWIGTESGIYIYNSQNGKLDQLQKQYSNFYSLSDNAIYTIYKDRDGGIWAGTYFGGINYYSSQNAAFTKYFPQKDVNSISGSDVREICKDNDGNLWIGTEDAGLNKLDAKTGTFKSFQPDGTSKSIAYSNIHGLLINGDKLWIGTFEHGLDILDIKTKKIIKHYKAGQGNSLRTNFIVTFCKTRSGEILVATINGVYKYNRPKDDFELVPGLPLIFYSSLLEDSQGNIWAGSFSNGIYKFRFDVKGFKNYRNNAQDKKSLSSNAINGIFEDTRHHIWVTTDGGGLNLFNAKNQNFKHYNVKNGLPSNFLFRILEDEDQKLWISSTKGLIQFDTQSEQIQVYSQSNGLLTDQFNYSSAFKDSDGRLYFGSVKGLISFFPAALANTHLQSPIFLTGFQIDNEESLVKGADSVLKKSIVYTDTLTLSDKQSSFSFDFAALSFSSPDMTKYAYRMGGLSKDWVYLKTNRKVYFTKLGAGKYLFEVKALVNGNDVWSQNKVKVMIRILPPLYKSLLAYFLYFLLITVAIIYLVLSYHKRIELQNRRRMELFENKKEKEIYQAKIEFFTNVAHEIRTPLTLIKGPMEKLIKQAETVPLIEKNLKIMNRNTDRLLNLTNQLLDFRKTEIKGFSLNFVKANVTEILQDIFLSFQTAAEQKDIKYELNLPKHNLHAYIDVEAFYKIMSNLVDNALKYGETLVKINLLFPDTNVETFKVLVESDGLLIPKELREKIFEPFFRATENEVKHGTGIGLSISKSLTELHKGQLYAEENSNNHNIFVLELPLRQLIEFNLNGKWKKL